MIDHDRLFKELLTQFFGEFVELFLPEVAKYLDPSRFEFLDKEVFTDVTSGDRHEVDLVVKARFRGADAFFLLHVENQASPEPEFARRMFRYFARLHERHDLPVYPIAVFTYDAPERPEPDRYRVGFPDRTVLDFSFTVIQLNRLNWRDFVRRPNPVASALMSKMNVAPEDRPRVKLECLRLLATLKLDRAKMQLIAGFVDTYLRLTPVQEQAFRHEARAVVSDEQEKVMEIVTSWEERGIHQGKTALVLRQLRHRFGDVPEPVGSRIDTLTGSELDLLAEALLDFTSLADAQTWLDAHAS